MTKEITKAYILQEMQDKLRLRELIPEKFSFSEMVIPTYSIEQHIQTWLTKKINSTITSTGPVAFIAVPDNEKWFVSGYTITFISGVFTFAGMYVSRRSDYTSFVYLDLTAAQNVAYTVNLPKVCVLGPGDHLYGNIDGYTSTGTLRMDVDYMKEEIR